MFRYAVYPSTVYIIVFTVSFWCWFLFEMWVFSRDRGSRGRGSLGSGRWLLIGIIVGITLGVNLPGLAPGLNISSNFPIYFVIGIVLIWAGLLFRFWAIQALGSFFSTRLVIQDGHQLITTGPYRYIRNPAYTGALATFIGIGLAIGNWLSLGLLALTVIGLYVWRIQAEDKLLSAAFGPAYQEYKQKTWALIPFVW